MKKIFVTLLFLSTMIAFGQNIYQDVVLLKSGEILRGRIIELIPDSTIMIEIAEGNISTLDMNEIEKITKVKVSVYSYDTASDVGFKTGYKLIIELGRLSNTNYFVREREKYMIDIINGYQIHNNFSIGLGTGVRYYISPKAMFIPVYFDVRATCNVRRISPYLSFASGLSFDATDKFRMLGFFFSPTIGFNYKVSQRSAINIGFGFERHEVDAQLTGDDYYYGIGDQRITPFKIVVGFSL